MNILLENKRKTNFRKPAAWIVLLVFILNLFSFYFILPAEKANAIAGAGDSVVVVGNTDPLEATYKAYDKLVQSGQFAKETISATAEVASEISTGVTAVNSTWDRVEKTAISLANLAAQQMLYEILRLVTNDIIKWINGGGTPKFVSDWQGFLRDAADNAAGQFLKTALGDWICKPFSVQLKLALADVTFKSQSKCSLTSIGKNLTNFFENFSNGGWTSWLTLSQPNNNFYGLYGMALNEKNRQAAAAAEAAKNEALSSGGFLSSKKCNKCTVGAENGASQTFTGTDECESWQKAMQSGSPVAFSCTSYTTQTPGSIIQNEAQQAIDQGRQMLIGQITALTGDSIMGIKLAPFFTAIFNALLKRAITLGLSNLAELTTSGSSSSDTSTSDSYYYDTASSSTTSGTNYFTTNSTTQSYADYSATETQVLEDLANGQSTAQQINLLNENKQAELAQAQKNQTVIESIQASQKTTLNTLVKANQSSGCSLPSWASSQLISETTNDSDTASSSIKSVKITADGIGNITYTQQTSTNELGQTSNYEITSISPEAVGIQEKIDAINASLTNIATASSTLSSYLQSAQDFSDLYSSSTSDSGLSSAASALATSRSSTISALQKSVGSSSSSDFTSLNTDVKNSSLSSVENANSYEMNRGDSTNTDTDTLYGQLYNAGAKLSEAESALSSCQ